MIKTFINTEQKKAIIKAFKNLPKVVKKYEKGVEKKRKIEKKEEEKTMKALNKVYKKQQMKIKVDEAKERISKMNMDEKELLLRHIYSDIFEALKQIAKFSKPKMVIFISALDKKTTQSELTKAYLTMNKEKGDDKKNNMTEELEEENFVDEFANFKI